MAEPTTPVAPHQQVRRNTKKKVLLSILGFLMALPVIAIIVILTFDWNRARPWINDKVSDAIDRPFAIRGDLTVSWERPATQMAAGERRRAVTSAFVTASLTWLTPSVNTTR